MASGSADPMDLSPLGKGKEGKKGKGKGKGDKTTKPKECFDAENPNTTRVQELLSGAEEESGAAR